MYPIHLPDNNDAKCNNKNYVCDYKQYYNNKKGLRSYRQALSFNTVKNYDENFKLNIHKKRFCYFSNYETRRNATNAIIKCNKDCVLNTYG